MADKTIHIDKAGDVDPSAQHIEQKGSRESTTTGGYYIDPKSIPGGTGGLPRNPDGSERK